MERFRPAHVIAADTELAQRLHAGEEGAVRTLVDRYGPTVYGVAFHFAPDADVANAATVHTLVQAWRSAELFAPGRDFGPWLASLTRRAVAVATGTTPGLSELQRVWTVQAALSILDDDERISLQASHCVDVQADAEATGGVAPGVVERAQRRFDAQLADAFAVEPDESMSAATDPTGDVSALLATPATWAQPRAGLGDRVLQAIEAEAVMGPPTPMSPPADRTSRSRGWLRPALIGVAATVAFLFGGLVVLAALNDPGERRVFDVELVPTGVVDDAGGTAEVTASDAGVRVDLEAVGLPRREGGRHYAAWLRLDDGTGIPIGTFHDGFDVVLWGGVEFERVARMEITLEDPVPADDPAQASSGQVALKASFDDATER